MQLAKTIQQRNEAQYKNMKIEGEGSIDTGKSKEKTTALEKQVNEMKSLIMHKDS